MINAVPGSKSDAIDDVAAALLATVRGHIERIRREPLDHRVSPNTLRQHREYGLGMIRMLAEYHDIRGIGGQDCLLLAVELDEACQEAIRRASVAHANADGDNRRRSGSRWRKGLQRGGGVALASCSWRAPTSGS